MAETSTTSSVYHVLLIGISDYPPGYNSLNGCVNDIDAIEQLLYEPLGIGVPTNQIHITRLAAPVSTGQYTSRVEDQTKAPNMENVCAALTALAGPDVKANDRVLVYFSGHGSFDQVADAPTHEMLVLNGGDAVEFLYDVEFNRYLAAIAARTRDVNCVLDCCHSAGATKGIPTGKPGGAARLLRNIGGRTPQPDRARLARSLGDPKLPARMLGALDPDYLAIAACQAEETAHEGVYGGGPTQGALTLSLLQLLGPMTAAQRAQTRWADIYPQVVESVHKACASQNQPPQQPAYSGRSERHIFGGPWVPQDPGFSITRLDNGQYSVGTGTLFGVTPGAELAVYGKDPAFFPFLNSEADLKHRIGMLKLIGAERSQCTAQVVGVDFALEGARARLVKPGPSLRLRVLVNPPDADLTEFLEASPLLSVVPPGTADAEVRVTRRADGGWTIGNDTADELASVPPGQRVALRAGLESYFSFNKVIRLERESRDAQLKDVLGLRILDCNDPEKLQAADPLDPKLAEAPRDPDGIYNVPARYRFCIEVTSKYRDLDPSIPAQDLHVTLFDCTAGGAAQYLGDTTLRWHKQDKQGDRQIIWRANVNKKPFVAGLDPGFKVITTDRLVAIATTRKNVDLQPLRVDKTVQMVIDELVGSKGIRDIMGNEDPEAQKAPVELWTAAKVSLRMREK